MFGVQVTLTEKISGFFHLIRKLVVCPKLVIDKGHQLTTPLVRLYLVVVTDMVENAMKIRKFLGLTPW